MSLKYIKASNLPPNLGLLRASVVYLLMDKFDGAQWVHGIVWTLFGIILIANIYLMVKAKAVDLFKDEKK